MTAAGRGEAARPITEPIADIAPATPPESPRVDGPAEHSILFKPPMIRALLAEITRPGTGKTQTRRVVSSHNSEVLGHRYRATSPAWAGLDFTRAEVRTRSTMMLAIAGKDAPFDLHLSVPWKHPDDPPGWEATYRVRPVWEVGDRIVVREKTRLSGTSGFGGETTDVTVEYWEPFADHVRVRTFKRSDPGPLNFDRWTPSIHMPRWAARIVLIVTEVRAQRIQEIDPRDAWAEGARCACMSPVPQCKGNVDAFRALWDSINAARGHGWDAGGWVWAITFKPELIPPSTSGTGPAASAARPGGQQERGEGR